MAKKASSTPEYVEKEATDDILVRMYDPGKNNKARASLTLEVGGGKMVIYGNAVNGKNGWFFSYPQYKTKEGEYKNLVFALDKEVNDAISGALEEAAEAYGVAN